MERCRDIVAVAAGATSAGRPAGPPTSAASVITRASRARRTSPRPTAGRQRRAASGAQRRAASPPRRVRRPRDAGGGEVPGSRVHARPRSRSGGPRRRRLRRGLNDVASAGRHQDSSHATRRPIAVNGCRTGPAAARCALQRPLAVATLSLLGCRRRDVKARRRRSRRRRNPRMPQRPTPSSAATGALSAGAENPQHAAATPLVASCLRNTRRRGRSGWRRSTSGAARRGSSSNTCQAASGRSRPRASADAGSAWLPMRGRWAPAALGSPVRPTSACARTRARPGAAARPTSEARRSVPAIEGGRRARRRMRRVFGRGRAPTASAVTILVAVVVRGMLDEGRRGAHARRI